MSDLNNSLTSRPERTKNELIKKEAMSKSLVFKTYKKQTKNEKKKYDFSQIVLSESLVFVSERANELKRKTSHSLTVSERMRNERMSEFPTLPRTDMKKTTNLILLSFSSEKISFCFCPSNKHLLNLGHDE